MKIRKITNRKQESVLREWNKLERRVGIGEFKKVFKTVTTDNGSEFLDYESLEELSVNPKKQRLEQN